MRIVESKATDWVLGENHSFVTPEGLVILPDHKSDICDFAGIPTTLVNVDQKYGTNTTLDVLRKTEKVSKFMVDGEGKILSVLDPKSTFMPDDKFDSVVSTIEELGGTLSKSPKSRGLARRAIFDVPETDSVDIFEGDIFRRQLIFERCPQGGVYLGIGLLRLACTNGMLVTEKQFKKLIRSSEVDKGLCQYFMQEANNFKTKTYLRSIFFDQKGTPYQASVANFLGMRDQLAKVTSSEYADEMFPKEPIYEHYEAQGISVGSSPRAILDHLPSGLEYYKCFNILTHGIKASEDMNIADEVAVGDWASDRRLKFVRVNNVHFEGQPTFNDTFIRHLMGDFA